MQLKSSLKSWFNIKVISLFLTLCLFIFSSIFVTFYYADVTGLIFKILATTVILVIFAVFLISYSHKMLKLYRLLFVIMIFCAILVIAYVLLKYYNVLDLFESMEELQTLILSTGNWGKLVFMLIQFLQVCLIPIPAVVTTLAGVAIYGTFQAFVLSTIAIIIGALAAFLMGRLFGYPLVRWIIGEETTNKYREILNEKGRYLLILMFILPIFPDDILCMVAGITTMSGKFFTLATLITRPITTFVICYFGGGQIIPYYGWGLIAWPIIIILMALLFVWTYKHNDKIEDFFVNKIFKKKIRKEK